MKLKEFHIKNYKGIEDMILDFDKSPAGNIYTLVGLNESGKTTIFEAMNSFQGWVETLASVIPEREEERILALVPRHKLSNFSGEIVFKASFVLNDADKATICQLLEDEGIKMHSISEIVHLVDKITFEDSVYKDRQLRPSIIFDHECSTQIMERGTRVERMILDCLCGLLPAFLFFPTTVFDVPDTIRLDVGQATERDYYYQRVLQDALETIDTNFSLEYHIKDRINDNETSGPLESTIQKLNGALSKRIFSHWKDIFPEHNVERQEIVLSATNGPDGRALRIRLRQGTDYYEISERSLGFRWFFAFLLLTSFRIDRVDPRREVLLVFDEPASNLHSTAQQVLMKTFGKMSKKATILFSTHSHHLISPIYLENTFIVFNNAIKYEGVESPSEFDRSVDINLASYRRVVAESSSPAVYYQPILEALDYQMGPLELAGSIVLLEGKNDYYGLRLLLDSIEKSSGFRLLPCCGSGGLDPVISFLIGFGFSFVVVLDSDRAGMKEKRRYLDSFGPVLDGRILTLGDAIPGLDGATESLFSQSECASVLVKCGVDPTMNPNKKEFWRLVQELNAKHEKIEVCSDTRDKLIALCTKLESTIALLGSA